MDEKWSAIIAELGEGNFTDFVRYYHNAHYPLVTKKKLFVLGKFYKLISTKLIMSG
jgi:hypothetical protein